MILVFAERLILEYNIFRCNVCVENVVDEQKDKGLDLDEEMLMTGLAMFENDF